MWWIAAAFLWGYFVPFMARRFAKFMPATFAGAMVEMFRPEKKLKAYRKLNQYKLLRGRCFVFAWVAAAITAIAYHYFGRYGFAFTAVYIWLLLLLAEIDYRTFLLPDILTVPLLILGFLAASVDMGFVAVGESAVGATIGYFLPTLVSLLIVWRKKDAFGGGDIKLLAAVGAWVGVKGLLYVIVAASVLGFVYAFAVRKKALAFGPMIAIAGIIVAFCLF